MWSFNTNSIPSDLDTAVPFLDPFGKYFIRIIWQVQLQDVQMFNDVLINTTIGI